MTAYATQTFSDVPDTNPFFDEIEWMADTGISTGFPDGTYRPAEPVSRQAMSAFMQRLYDLNVGNGNTSQQTQATFNVTSLSTGAGGGWTNIPGVSNPIVIPEGTTGRVHVNLSMRSNCHGGSNGVLGIDPPITFRPACMLRVTLDGAPMNGIDNDYYVDSSNSGNDGPGSWRSVGVVRYSEVLSPGIYTIVPQVTRFNTTFGPGYSPPSWNVQHAVMTTQVELTAAP
ncbi:MAG: S-layer homology domain-containing protein [Acidimicrobiia bacterium]|nr:S-layer homology domain-containing protein [Acidimicrobiia bacterium]